MLVSDGGAGNVVYHLYGNSHLGQQVQGSSQFQTFITDGLGSVRVEMETSGATNYVRTFSPFGETLDETGTSSSVYGYTGQQEDASTGLIYLRARYYSAELKAFTAYDVWQGINRRPQTMNHYAYTENNPINNSDPTGNGCIIIFPTMQRFCFGPYAPIFGPPAPDQQEVGGGFSQIVDGIKSDLQSALGYAELAIEICYAIAQPYIQQDIDAAQDAIDIVSDAFDKPNPTPQATVVPPILTPQPQPTPSPTPQKQYSLDTNALIALEKWIFNTDNSLNGSGLETKVNGRKIYVSNVAKSEFLRGTHPNTKSNYNTLIRKYSITEVSNVPSSTLTQITQIAQNANVNVTKQNTVNDLKILASAIGVNSKLLSKEKKLIELFPTHVESW